MYQNSIKFAVTTSWDDGAPEDRRLADLLLKYGIGATFYIPLKNLEKRAVLSPSEIQKIAANFEVGSHTYDHIYLNRCSLAVAKSQIVDGKKVLEDIIGEKIKGFCYPGGKYDNPIVELVKNADFLYARTTKNLFNRTDKSSLFEMPVSVQFYPRKGFKHLKGFLMYQQYIERWPYFYRALMNDNLVTRLKIMIDYCVMEGVYFHLWGHSWEIEELGLWSELEEVFCYMSKKVDSVNLVDNYRASLC